MKKRKFLLVILALCAAMCFGLCACDDESNDEYKSERLTADNIHRFLAFNITISDCTADYIETNILNDRVYNLSCVVTISTTRAADCHFEGAHIGENDTALSPAVILYDQTALKDILGGGWLPVNTTLAPRICAQIGYNGESAISFSVNKENVIGLNYPNTATVEGTAIAVTTPKNIVSYASGMVYYK